MSASRREFIKAAGLAATGAVAATNSLSAAATSRPQAQATPTTAGARLRQLLQSGETFANVNAYDVMTARMVELIGFPSIFIGGTVVSEYYGMPDWALTSVTERLQVAGHIASHVNTPCMFDIDDGGDPLVLYRATQEFEHAGLGGLQLVDGSPDEPNLSTFMSASKITPMNKMVDKIHAMADARSDIAIIVRCQGYRLEGKEQTIERGIAYAEAGADALWFMPGPLEEQGEFAAAVQRPLLTLMDYDQPLSVASDAGVTMAVYASLVQNIAQGAVYDALMEFRDTGTWTVAAKGRGLGSWIPGDFRQRMLQLDEHNARVDRYNMPYNILRF